jgi:hypothetical protein
MNAPRIPISLLLSDKSTDAANEDVNQKKSREDWRKAKELEEARKAGNAPAAVDEEGKIFEINKLKGLIKFNFNFKAETSIHTFHNTFQVHRGIMEPMDQH